MKGKKKKEKPIFFPILIIIKKEFHFNFISSKFNVHEHLISPLFKQPNASIEAQPKTPRVQKLGFSKGFLALCTKNPNPRKQLSRKPPNKRKKKICLLQSHRPMLSPAPSPGNSRRASSRRRASSPSWPGTATTWKGWWVWPRVWGRWRASTLSWWRSSPTSRRSTVRSWGLRDALWGRSSRFTPRRTRLSSPWRTTSSTTPSSVFGT